jgi:adenylate kinase family enzyme
MAIVHLVFGSQGAGKTTYSRQLAEQTEGTRFSIESAQPPKKQGAAQG